MNKLLQLTEYVSLMKCFLRVSLYFSGVLGGYHHFRNRDVITVVAFHRVLGKNDIRWHQADSDWSVTDDFYQQCILFFKKHYHLISLQDLEHATKTGASLSACSLLITFDDGWSDNYDYALKIHQENKVEPLLFVTTSAIGKKILSWQETLFSAWKLGLLSTVPARKIFALLGNENEVINTRLDIAKLTKKIQDADDETRQGVRKLAEGLAGILPGDDQMLSKKELKSLYENGVSVGTHGVLHEPLLHSENAKKDLIKSKEDLSALVNASSVSAMSYPHGQENQQLIEETASTGYKFIFTGREHLNRLEDNLYYVFGRLNIEQERFQNSRGKLDKASFAFYLFKQTIKTT